MNLEEQTSIRHMRNERVTWEEAAALKGVGMAVWLRLTATRIAKMELRKHKKEMEQA